MGLGPYPAIGLSDARIAAADARKLIARGVPWMTGRHHARPNGQSRHSEISRKPSSLMLRASRAMPRSAINASDNLGLAYSGPLLARPVHEITTVEVASLLRPIWRTKPEVARKLYPAIRRVFEHARVLLRDEHAILMPDNPVRWSDLKATGFETPMKLTGGSHPSLPYTLMAAFMADLRERRDRSPRT
jgi:hypothetical protein